MDDSEIQAIQPRAYPPSILIGGAGLVAVLAGIVVSVVMVGAASVEVPHVSPPPRLPAAATPAVRPTAVATAAVEPTPQNSLEGFVAHLTPQLPALDRVLQAP